ncbi:MAG: hypothetical protein ACM3O4_05490 [Ignavibacteriales bacterium]
MRKVFLYLYPIKEYPSALTFSNEFYEEHGWDKPFDALNECIQKRYRGKGYEIIFVTYPDKAIYGIDIKPNDKIITTDVTFKEASGYDDNGKEKPIEEVKYPSEEDIMKKVGPADQVTIGGYHFADCVKRVAEYFHNNDIDTLVDLELTDLFFNLYRKEYFNRSEYSTSVFKKRLLSSFSSFGSEFAEMQFNKMYGSPIYHFNSDTTLEVTDSKKR